MEQQIMQAISRCQDYIKEKYGFDIQPEIDLGLKGKAAGMAMFYADDSKYRIRLNMEAGVDYLVEHTVPHEMAHLLQAAFGSRMDHGKAWQHYCIELGGNGEMYHTLKLTPARKTRTFLYRVGGEDLVLTIIRHNKIQNKGQHYKSLKTGAIIGKDNFVKEI